MRKFTYKQVVFEAVQWDGTTDSVGDAKTLIEFDKLPPAQQKDVVVAKDTGELGLHTMGGLVSVKQGEWIIKGSPANEVRVMEQEIIDLYFIEVDPEAKPV